MWHLEQDSVEITSISSKIKKLRPFTVLMLASRLQILEAHILRSEGRDNFKFCFWQFLVNLNKCAKFYLNLSRCLPGAGQACADLPLTDCYRFEVRRRIAAFYAWKADVHEVRYHAEWECRLQIRIMLRLLYYGPDTDFVKENGLDSVRDTEINFFANFS